MKKIKKRYIVIFLLFFLLGVLVAGVILYFPHLFTGKVIPKTVDVFGAPRAQATQNFPSEKPEFTAVIGKIKSTSVQQQSIKIYQIGDTKKTIVFERPFYADGFRGNDLTYTFSSGSAEITQKGSLISLGCKSEACILPWENFYIWNANQHTFMLDNISHQTEFKNLLAMYKETDTSSCGIVGNNVLFVQQGLSLTELYKKFPTASYYCSQNQGILPANLVFFLQTEKTLQEIVKGSNLGSTDIRDIQI